MVKWYDEQKFSSVAGGVWYDFYAHTTYTRNGFCHTIETRRNGCLHCRDTKVSYINRTWERFTYETALKRAIEKCPKEDRQALYDALIEKKAKDEHDRCEAFVSDFKEEYDKLSDKNKEIMRNAAPIETEGQAKSTLMAMRMMNLLS